MNRWLPRGAGVFFIAVLLSYTPFKSGVEIFTIIYTVIGIMFSIALSQLMAFSFSDITNPKFVQQQRNQLSHIRSSFITLFSVSTVALILTPYAFILHIGWFKIDFEILILVYFLFCLLYFIINFIDLAKLKDEIEDEIRDYKSTND